jgi:CDP-diacylglycerol--serine O-phosphatidyltransferase
MQKKLKPVVRLKQFPITRMIPNIATVMALCVGLSSIRFALMGRFQWAVVAILIAGILDFLDGRLARMLGAASDFGAELDSLSDFVSFGASPAVVLYLCSMHAWRGFGWSIVLFFAVCSALRLARFNTVTKSSEVSLPANFFIGVPAPAGAFLAILPMIISFAFEFECEEMPALYVFALIVASFLMISRLPTFSIKSYTFPRRWSLPLLVVAGLVVAALLSAPWETLVFIGILYILSLPVSYVTFKRLRNKR